MFDRLLLCHVLLEVLLVSAQAPGDADGSSCQAESYPTGWRVLMDSRNYEDLVGGSQPAWRSLDLDGQGQGWRHRSGGSCMREVRSCDFSSGQNQENWLFTQLISYEAALQVTVETTFDLSECQNHAACLKLYFDLHSFELNGESDENAMTNTSNYHFLHRLVNLGGMTHSFVPSANKTGFHLALQDSGSCVSVSRIIVYYPRCPPRDIPGSFIRFPAVAIPIDGSVVYTQAECTLEKMEGVGDLNAACYSNGSLVVEGGECACSAGYVFNSTLAECQACPKGQYKATISNTDGCLPCPANSEAATPASPECQCQRGYVRPSSVAVHQQCLDLDPPRSLRNASNSSSIRICWLPSLDALSFDLFYGVYLKEQLTDCFVKLADINAVATGNLTLEMCYQLSDDDIQLDLQKSAIEGDSQFEFLVTVNFEASLNPPKISNLSEVEGRMSRVVVLLETTENGTSEPSKTVAVVLPVVLAVFSMVFAVAVVAIVVIVKKRSNLVSTGVDTTDIGDDEHKDVPQQDLEFSMSTPQRLRKSDSVGEQSFTSPCNFSTPQQVASPINPQSAETRGVVVVSARQLAQHSGQDTSFGGTTPVDVSGNEDFHTTPSTPES